jgi:hypothetical protein
VQAPPKEQRMRSLFELTKRAPLNSKRCMPSWQCIRLRACEAKKFGRGKMHVVTGVANNLPKCFALIHGRAWCGQALGRRCIRDPHLAVRIPVKGALCFIPAFVVFWLRAQSRFGRVGAIGQSSFHKSAVDWLPSRLSLRLPNVFDHQG